MEQLATGQTGYDTCTSQLSRWRLTTPPSNIHHMPSQVDRTHTEETVQKVKSPCDQASAYIQNCKSWYTGSSGRHDNYEKPLIIKMPLRDWYKLKSDINWGESDKVYPSLSYNALTATLIIQCMPSPLHESINITLTEQFVEFKANFPRDFGRGLRISGAQDFKGFEGRWEGSEKRPDLGIKQINADEEFELKCVLEVGFSESYQDLVEDAQLWLEGYPEVSMVILVKFKETPLYRRPIPPDVDPEEYGIPSRTLDVRPKDITLEEEFGQAIYQELVWVHQISQVWMEIWVRDANGNAIRNGDRKDLLRDAQIEIPFEDFLELPPGFDGTMIVDLEDFRYLLKKNIQELAVNRCRGAIMDYRKRMGHDEAYQP